ncbi:Hypothetical predicted protein [Paramuricea clavata]|uniref:Uncharacterized protein n=1 Tax=Paramuricea clavata TaxID=317549 RepID=A0A7D9DT02_PARCT|nr:Hypothetical predicted protein [Paramuricea clavata]
MAYWKNYRKYTSQVHALALDNNNDEDVHCLSDDSFFQLNNSFQSQTSITSIQSEAVDSEQNSMCDSSDNDEPRPPPSSDTTLRHDLSCWATRNQCTRNTLNQLLHILNSHGHSLPIDSRTLLQTPRNVSTQQKCGGQYIYFGVEESIHQILSKYPFAAAKLTAIELVLNVDGLPLFKSSNRQFWPILGRYGNLEVFVISLFYESTKPNSVGDYLEDYIKEVNKLLDSGITHEGRHFNFTVRCFCCVAPGRCFLKCVVGHTAYFACKRCTFEGSWDGRVVYNLDNNAVLRTDELFSSLSYEVHQKELSPLLTCGVSCVKQFILDYMHMVCLGVTKRILHYLKNGPCKCKLSSIPRKVSHFFGGVWEFFHFTIR